MPSRETAGPSQATPAWTTLPDGVFDAILDRLCQKAALAAARSTCKAWKTSVSLHQKSLAATLSDETLKPCAAAFPRLQSLRVELDRGSAVLDDFSSLSALSQLQSLTLDLGGFAACLGAREMSQLPGSIRQLILSRASISTEGLSQLPSLAHLRELDVRGCKGALDRHMLLEVLPELKSLEVFGVGIFGRYRSCQEVNYTVFWDTLCRLSCLTALQLDDYGVPRTKERLKYPAGLKHFELLRGYMSSSRLTGMLSSFPQLESLVVADSGWGSLSLQGVRGLTSLSLSNTPTSLSTVESLSLKELRLAGDSFMNPGIYMIASMQQLTKLELEHITFWGPLQPLLSLNLKELALNKTMSGACAELLVPGSLQGLEVLDLRTMSELPTDNLHEVAVAIMLLPKLKILAGDCGIIRQVVGQSPNSWAVCTADDIVEKYGPQTAYIRIR